MPKDKHARVRAAFNGETPDRTPICEQAFASSVASEILGYEAYTGSTDLHWFEACAWLDGDNAHDEFVEKCWRDTVAIHRAMDYDIFMPPWRMAERPCKRVGDYSILYGDLDSGDWRVYAYDPVSRTYGLASQAPRRAAFHNDCDAVLARVRAEVDAFQGFDEKPAVGGMLARAVRELGDEFVIAGGAGCALPLEAGWLEASALDPELFAAWFTIIGAWQALEIEAQHDAGIWLINGGGDLAFNSGLCYSPRFYQTATHLAFQAQFDVCRKLGMRYIFRSDGNLWAITDLLFGANGASAYYEIDHNASMTFDKLRERYPALVLFGNVPCDLLRNGTPAQVRELAQWCRTQAGPRHVLGSANSILHGTPAENVFALYETRS